MTQPLAFDIIARDRASDTTKRIGSGFSRLGATTKGVFAGMGAAVGLFAVQALGQAARAVGAFVADSVRQFSDFDRGMREVWTLLPDLSASAFKGLQGDVKGFVTEMGIAHQEAVPALYQAISAGVPQENVFDFLTTAAKASIGGVTSLDTAVDGLTSVTNAYGREVLSAQEASDIFFTTVRLGKTTMGELSASLFQVVPTAASLGISFGTVGAALATITTQGVPTSVATTQLRQLFVELNKEGGKTATTFDGLAGKSFADFIQGGGTVQGALALLTQHAADSNTSLSNLFGSVEAGNAALALTSEDGARKFTTALGEVDSATGSTDAAFEKMEGSIGLKWDQLVARVGVFKLEIGEKLAPAISQVLDWLAEVATANEETGETFEELGTTARTEFARVVPQLEKFSASLSETAAENEGALKRLIEVSAGFTAAQMNNLEIFSTWLVGLKDETVRHLRTTSFAVLSFAEVVADAGVAAFGWVPGIGDQFRDAARRTREWRDKINDYLAGIQSHKVIRVSFEQIGTIRPVGSQRQLFQHGGLVAGPFTGVDRVPAMLTAGEFVMNREATARHEPLLRMMNAGAPNVTLNQSFSSSGSRADDFIIEVLLRGLRTRPSVRSAIRGVAR
jgi:TP901 family phage tail tape measure protein